MKRLGREGVWTISRKNARHNMQETMNKNRALFLDRDGVINADTAYVGSVEAFVFLPGLFPFLRAAQDRGYRLAVLTNQSGVARGFYTEDDYRRVTAHMLAAFAREGLTVDLTLACFEYENGTVAPYNRSSFWRKPNPGMVLEAIRRMDVNPARSAFLGDHLRDMRAAQAGGIGTCLWLTQEKTPDMSGVICVDTYEAALRALG